jgi:hypothetical protein
MGRSQLRRGVWALAILTCLTVAGGHTAYADDNHPRVEAAGWYFSTQYADAPNGSAEIKIGVTGKCDAGTTCPGGVTGPFPKARFEYFNTFTGLRVHGKITSMQFHPANCATDPNAPPGAPVGLPAVTVSGLCDETGESCSFQMDLVDGGDPGRGTDWVCNVMVAGQGKNNAAVPMDTEPAQPLMKGNIKIRNYQP